MAQAAAAVSSALVEHFAANLRLYGGAGGRLVEAELGDVRALTEGAHAARPTR